MIFPAYDYKEMPIEELESVREDFKAFAKEQPTNSLFFKHIMNEIRKINDEIENKKVLEGI